MQHAPQPQQMRLLEAIIPHVAFDGWSPQAFRAAAADCDMTEAEARVICPRGAVDLAVLFHREGDREMVARLGTLDMDGMRFRDKVARAVRIRLDVIPDKEAVRRGSALFSLPHMAPEGAKLIWGTADAIWTALGDRSDDLNWYTKRATLSGVYGAVVLYWLGDDSTDGQATDAFIDRRIADVMRFEKLKATARDNPLLKPFNSVIARVTDNVRKPGAAMATDLPGHWRDTD